MKCVIKQEKLATYYKMKCVKFIVKDTSIAKMQNI